jgi:Domain of unknown function (DUF4157)
MKAALQRKCACGPRTSASGPCAACVEEDAQLARKATHAPAPGLAPPIVHEVLASPGRPLEAATRARMESRFGHDFSGVRVHTNATAARSADAIAADAWTVGRDIGFASGRYNPGTRLGDALLAHELAHVVQQGQRRESTGELKVDPSALAEREAEQHADAVMHAQRPHAGTYRQSLMRQPTDPRPEPPRNVGPPVSEVPKPPICSFVWKNGRFYWKCEGVPGIGSTPDIPLDPRDIPREVREKLGGLGKPPDSAAPPGSSSPIQVWPPPPTAGLPARWLETLCQRDPRSPLCLPLAPRGFVAPPSGVATRPTGPLWTDNVTFEFDQPSAGGRGIAAGVTAEGSKAIEDVVFWLNNDPSLRVRLIGHTSSEGDSAHNLELSRRRVRFVQERLRASGLADRIADPLLSDGQEGGCETLGPGLWACGEQKTDKEAARPEDRKVEATIIRSPFDVLRPGAVTLPAPTLGSESTR